MTNVLRGVAIVLFAMLATAPQRPMAQGTGDRDLRAAMETETVKGDWKAALKLYQAVVDKYQKTDRATAATALMRMADFYAKMGDAEAIRIYRRVMSDFADQPAAAEARLRLGSEPAQTDAIVSKRVWSGPEDPSIFLSSISPDERFWTYESTRSNGSIQDSYVRDLATGTDRKIDQFGYAMDRLISPDGRQIAYLTFKGSGRWELRLASLIGEPHPQVLYDNPEVGSFHPLGWSPDGKSLVGQVDRRDRTKQIALLSVPDGTLRVLKSMDWRGSHAMAFSPDGKYVAYDLPQSDTSQEYDVFVLAVDGTRESAAVVHPSNDTMVGWSPDGRWLLFSSDRTGSTDIWGVAFSNGRPEGDPQRLLKNFGADSSPMGISRSGRLYYRTGIGPVPTRLQRAVVDITKGTFSSSPLTESNYLVSTGDLKWSPDGRRVAYAVQRGPQGARVTSLAIRAVEDERVREVTPKLSYLDLIGWVPDGRSVLLAGDDFKGRTGLYRVDADTGVVDPLALDGEFGEFVYDAVWSPDGTAFLIEAEGPAGDGVYRVNLSSGKTDRVVPASAVQTEFQPTWAPDGAHFFYRRIFTRHPVTRIPQDMAIVERNLASGEERELVRRPFLGAPNVTPDGQYKVTPSTDAATNTRVLLRVSTTGTDSRVLMRVASGVEPDSLIDRSKGQFPFVMSGDRRLQDNNWVLVQKRLDDRIWASEVWLVPITSGEPKKIGDIPAGFVERSVSVSLDGRQVAYTIRSVAPQPPEVWAYENFLPRATGAGK